ncbi:MAG: peptidylprolyl isomerase [Rubrivivax sp.]
MKPFSLRALLALLGALLLLLATPARAQGTMVRVHTSLGPIDMRLLDDAAPITVANFLAYARAGDWRDMFFHRSARLANGTPFVVQGGGFRWPEASATCCTSVVTRGAIKNEFSAQRSNLRGTVAMAKLGGNPDSATSQWFVNMGNNAANLDNQNGGFTVFAQVTGPGMVVADRIAALPIVNAGGNYAELPVIDYVSGQAIQRRNMVLVSQVTELPVLAQQSDSDRIFNYLEAAYPQYLASAPSSTGTFDGYTYRHYASANAYVGTKDGKVWYLVPAVGPNIGELGTMASWLATAQQAGY